MKPFLNILGALGRASAGVHQARFSCASVAQTSSLLCRRLLAGRAKQPAGRAFAAGRRLGNLRYGRLEARATRARTELDAPLRASARAATSRVGHRTGARRPAPLLLLLLCLAFPAPARAYVYINVSVKVFLDTTNNWPSWSDPMALTSQDQILARMGQYNGLLDSMGWGFRLNLVDVRTLSGQSEWFDADAGSKTTWAALEEAILDDRPKFDYRPDAINVYLNNFKGRSVASGRPDVLFLGDLILLNQSGAWDTLLHEIGHTLTLKHTHGGCNDPDDCGSRWRDDDGCDDTLFDYPYTNRNAIAVQNFGSITLSDDQWRQVDDLFRNLMSYHDPTRADCRLTHDQWEKIVDVCNDPLRRRITTSGSTVFVETNAPGLSPCELLNNLASFLGGFDWPEDIYREEYLRNPPTPELLLRRACNVIQIKPPRPPAPPGYPSDLAWPPLSDLLGNYPPKPPGYPDGWPWPPVPPASLEVCIGGAYKSVENAIGCAALDGDRIQIKAGHYNERFTISKKVVLTTDPGPGRHSVFIGKP